MRKRWQNQVSEWVVARAAPKEALETGRKQQKHKLMVARAAPEEALETGRKHKSIKIMPTE